MKTASRPGTGSGLLVVLASERVLHCFYLERIVLGQKKFEFSFSFPHPFLSKDLLLLGNRLQSFSCVGCLLFLTEEVGILVTHLEINPASPLEKKSFRKQTLHVK